MDQHSTILIGDWLNRGGVPYVDFKDSLARRDALAEAETKPPWETMWIKTSFGREAEACRLASVILHEMDHLARHDTGNSHPREFLDACTFGCIDPESGD